MTTRHPIINGSSTLGEAGLRDVIDPFHHTVIAQVSYASKAQVNEAITSAYNVFKSNKLSAVQRSEILKNASLMLADLSEEIARTITAESGKPITYSRIEVDRAVFTLKASAEAAKAFHEDLRINVSDAPGGKGKNVSVRYFPAGVLAAITPFNFPLNLVMHKVAPAIACGCPVVLKPAPQTPLTAFMLADIFHQCDLPNGWLNVVPCENDVAESIVTDDRVKVLSFTGSASVGWKLKSLVPKKKVTLELGGNGAVIVDNVDDWDSLIASLCTSAFYYAGQVCISLQRLFVKRELYDELLQRFIASAKILPLGDPNREDVVVGPMINQAASEKALGWIESAIASGAIKHTGDYQKPNIITPTILTNVDPNCELSCEEAFAPVVIVEPYDSFEAVIERVNSSRYGLQVGVFTDDEKKINLAYERLEAGGVIINNTNTFRIDTMPYGGVKDSGFGREGVLWAMEEMCEPKVLVR